MNKLEIALKKRNAVVLKNTEQSENLTKVMTLQANIIPLGFVLSETLAKTLAALDSDTTYNQLVDGLKKLKGADVEYRPMYPNFPQQVADASDLELFVNAIMHYWSLGQWMPDYEKLPREFAVENNKLIEIDLIDETEFAGIFTEILSSNDSISDYDKNVVKWFLNNYGNLVYPDTIPYKENVALIGAYMVQNGMALDGLVKTATDVLRVAVELSEGDVSLATNTKFKSLPRSQRRTLVEALDCVTDTLGDRQVAEDIYRYGGMWKRLGHSLHVGDFSNKAWETMNGIREGKKANHFYSDLEEFLAKKHYAKATKLLLERPGEMARRLDVLLRSVDTDNKRSRILNAFSQVSNKVSTRVLFQLRGHFMNRATDSDFRIVLPKGNIQASQKIAGQRALPLDVVDRLISLIDVELTRRFSEMESLGKVYISEEMGGCPLPSQQRESSDGLRQLARGTRVKIGDDQSTVRFFIYWVGRDIDLSAVFLNDDFHDVGRVSYTNLRDSNMEAYHSGDITNAYNGASEFIDINIDKARQSNKQARYVSMNVLVYSGPSFQNHTTCYAGWMARSKPNSNEIYDPKTVENKIDITWNTRNCVPLLIDLETREVIWVDLPSGGRSFINNVERNMATITEIMEMSVNMSKMKTTLWEVFNLHANARAEEIVSDREDADIVFDWDGDVTPYDVSRLNSEFLK